MSNKIYGLGFQRRQFCIWADVDGQAPLNELDLDITVELAFVPDNHKSQVPQS
jgi:hypothetical protein